MSLSKVIWGLALVMVLIGAPAFAEGAQESDSDEVSLDVWHYYSANTPVFIAFDWAVSQYEAEHPGVDVVVRAIPFGEFPREIARAATVGNPPDIAVGGPRIGQFMQEGFADISNHIANSSVISEEDYFPGSWKESTFEGGVYGISHDSNTIVLFWNKELFVQAGLDPESPPQTWDELDEYARAISDISSSVFGFSYTAPRSEEVVWQFLPVFWAHGALLGEPNSRQGVKALSLWTDLYQDGIVPPDALNFSQADQMDQFAAQNIGMVVDGPWDFYKLEDVDFEWGVTILPAAEMRASSLGGENMYFFEGDKVDEAFAFIEWTQRDAFLAEWMSRANRIPSKVAVANSTAWSFHDDERFAVVVEQLQHARARFYPKWSDFSLPLQTAIQSAITGQSSPQEALDAVAEIYREEDLIRLYENW